MLNFSRAERLKIVAQINGFCKFLYCICTSWKLNVNYFGQERQSLQNGSKNFILYTVFADILRLIYYPIQTKTSKIVIPTTVGAILEGTLNVNCFMVLLGMMGACKMGQKNLVFPYSFRGCSSQFITQFEILKQANAFLMLCRLVFLCPNQRLLLKTNEESATGLDLSIFVRLFSFLVLTWQILKPFSGDFCKT